MANNDRFLEILDGLHELGGSASLTDLAVHVECQEGTVEQSLQQMEMLSLVRHSPDGLEFLITDAGREQLSAGEGRLKYWIGIPSRWIDPETGRPIKDWR